MSRDEIGYVIGGLESPRADVATQSACDFASRASSVRFGLQLRSTGLLGNLMSAFGTAIRNHPNEPVTFFFRFALIEAGTRTRHCDSAVLPREGFDE